MKRAAIAVFVVTLSLCALVPSTRAQTGETRTIPLVVMGQDGKIVNDLTAENLRVKGTEARIQNVELDSRPRHVVLLLDISGSMKSWGVYGGRERWQYAKEMAKAFLDSASPRDFLALDEFAKTEAQSVPFTHDFTSIRRAIDALPEPGSKQAVSAWGDETWAGDALHAALLDIGAEPGFGDTVIFFSDGEFGVDDRRHSPDLLTAELARRGVRVFLAFAFGSQPVWNTDVPEDMFVFRISGASMFTENTGGFSFAPAVFPVFPERSPPLNVYRSDPLQKRMTALSDAVQGTYRVELQLDTPLRKKHGLQFQVTDHHGKTLYNLLLFYPRNLYPDSVKTP